MNFEDFGHIPVLISNIESNLLAVGCFILKVSVCTIVQLRKSNASGARACALIFIMNVSTCYLSLFFV